MTLLLYSFVIHYNTNTHAFSLRVTQSGSRGDRGHQGEITRNDWGRVRTRDIRELTKQAVAEKIGFREARKRNLSNFFPNLQQQKNSIVDFKGKEWELAVTSVNITAAVMATFVTIEPRISNALSLNNCNVLSPVVGGAHQQ